MPVSKDLSRTRKAYSYFRPRPIIREITTEQEMININNVTTQINSLTQTVNANNIIWNEIPTGAVDGVNASFTLAYTPHSGSKLLVFVNGVLQEIKDENSDFTISDRTITFSSAPRRESKILVTYAKS